MILLTAHNLLRQFDTDPVFRDVTFTVETGEKIGLVGPNGCGKTTLMGILARHETADVGTVDIHKTAEVELLEQITEFSDQQTLLDTVKEGLAHLYELQDQAHDLADAMAQADAGQLDRLQKQYDAVQHELDRHDAYQIDHRVEEVLHGLGFTEEEYDRPITTFSGGQQNRAILGRLLLAAPDLMLLDEPTNHLDIAATEWLEGFLARSSQAVLVVSHDRYFLDSVTQRTLELFGGQLHDYKGNFSAYWRQRDERHEVLRRTHKKQQEFIAKTEDFIRRNKYGQKHAQAADRVKKLERLERVELPQDFQELHMSFATPSRTGDWVIDAIEVEQGFDEPLIEDFTLRIHRGDRIGILGPNGSGKTTLLRTLIGELPPKEGEIRLGTGVEIGYFDQQLTSVDPREPAVEAVRPPNNPEMKPGELRKLLARFGVRGDLALQTVDAMSGGEKTKVALARLAAMNVNLLILDEPTNHLDFWACASLEETLKDYAGTILFVSHDRYFINRVATNVIVLEPNRWRYHEGNYNDYQHFLKATGADTSLDGDISADFPSEASASDTKHKDQSTKSPAPKPKRKFPYRKATEIEADVLALEMQINDLEQDLVDPDVLRDGGRIKQVQMDYEQAQDRLDELMEHWEEAIEMN